MEEGGILQDEAVSEARASGAAEGNLVVDGDMAGVNLEAKGSSQGDRGVLNDQVRMEVGEVDVVWETAIQQCEHIC